MKLKQKEAEMSKERLERSHRVGNDGEKSTGEAFWNVIQSAAQRRIKLK